MMRIDGRHARSTRTRVAVADAYLALLEEGELRPTADRIARQAAVSKRLLFHHFRDLDTLLVAATARRMERLAPLRRQVAAHGRVGERIREFLVEQARLHERMAPVWRAALLAAPASAEIAGLLRRARAAGRAEAARLFARELHAAADRKAAAAVLSLVASFSTWESLRTHQGLAVGRAIEVLERILSGAFASGPATPSGAGERTRPHRR